MVPKQRKTKSRRNQRRSHLSLSKKNLVKCSHCSRMILPHRMCQFCGYFKGRQIIDVMAKLSKRERKEKQKQEQARLEKSKKSKKGLSLEQLSRK